MTATSVIWWPTTQAANKMGLTKHQLLAILKMGIFTEGVQYRKAGMGHGFSWNIEATAQAIRNTKS